jgi:DNA repair exonuclease SbcCD ATPase subunit
LKEPEDSAELENKFKLSFLQIEKRLVDLETIISDLSTKVNEISTIPVAELKERMDDIEDLVMVEQAAVLELKKLLETTGVPSTPSGLEERIRKVEERLSNILTDINSKLQQYTVAPQFESKLNELEQRLEKLKEVTSRPETGFELVTPDIGGLKAAVDDLSKRSIELDLKMAELEKKVEFIRSSSVGTIPESILDEIKTNRKDLIDTGLRVDSLERVTRELVSNVQKLESSLKKLENLERVSLLSKDIEEKIERFKFIEGEMRRLSSKVEMMYESIDKRLDVVRNVEREFPKLSETISKLAKDIDKNKIDIIDRVKKVDMDKKLIESEDRLTTIVNHQITKRMEELRRDLEPKIRLTKAEETQKMLDEVNSRIDRIEEELKHTRSFVSMKVEELKSPSMIDQQMNELLEKIIFLESRLTAIERTLEETARVHPIIIE